MKSINLKEKMVCIAVAVAILAGSFVGPQFAKAEPQASTPMTANELLAEIAAGALEENITLTEQMVIETDTVLDLGGNTLSIQDGNISIQKGSLTVKNGAVINETGYAFRVEASDGNAVLNLENTVDVTAKDCCVFIKKEGSVLNTAGDLTSTGTFAAVSGNGSTGNGGIEVNITGGKILSEVAGVYFPNTTDLNITGGEIEGTTAVYHKSGNLTISGGVLNATGANAEYVHNPNGCDETGDALVIEACDYPGGVPVVSITGGKFVSEQADAIGYYQQSAQYALVNEKFITGGTFSTAPTANIADTHKSIASTTESGMFDVVKKVNSALTTDIAEKEFIAGDEEWVEFSFSTVANDFGGTMVYGISDFGVEYEDTIEGLEYWNGTDWVNMKGQTFGGKNTGFPMMDATSKFRVKFTEEAADDYTFTAYMKKVEDDSVLCQVEVPFEVREYVDPVLSTNIAEQTFVAGDEEWVEFTFSTVANDAAGMMVYGGSDFGVVNEDKIEGLEHWSGTEWINMKGQNFGGSAGFPMGDATSKFRVKFTEDAAGPYNFTAFMKRVSDNSDVCTLDIPFNVNAFNTTITLDKEDEILKAENTLTLTATTNSSKAVVWETSDPTVATVNEGVVTGLTGGKVTITATVNGKSDTCEVLVYDVAVNESNVLEDTATTILGTLSSIVNDILTTTDLNTLDIVENGVIDAETAQKIKDAVEAGKEIKAELSVNDDVEPELSYQEDMETKAKEVLGEYAGIAKYFDIGVDLVTDDEVLGRINVFEEELEIKLSSIGIVEDGRTLKVLRFHNGVIDALETVVGEDESIAFKTDRFSVYALAYTDGEPTKVELAHDKYALLQDALKSGKVDDVKASITACETLMTDLEAFSEDDGKEFAKLIGATDMVAAKTAVEKDIANANTIVKVDTAKKAFEADKKLKTAKAIVEAVDAYDALNKDERALLKSFFADIDEVYKEAKAMIPVDKKDDEKKEEDKEPEGKNDDPKTGDATNIVLWVGLLIVSLASAFVVLRKKFVK